MKPQTSPSPASCNGRATNGDLIHGHAVELVGEDDGGTIDDIAVVAANLLIDRPGLVGIVGPAFSSAADATIDLYAAAGIVMISGSATRRDLTLNQSQPGFFFRTAFTNTIQGARQAEILIDRITTGSAVIIDDGEDYGIDLARKRVTGLRDAGWTTLRITVPQGTVDFSAVIERIQAAAPDAVIFEGFNPDGALLLGQLRESGYGEMFVTGDGVVSQSGFLDVLGADAEGAILTGCPEQLSDEFVEIWEDTSGRSHPHHLARRQHRRRGLHPHRCRRPSRRTAARRLPHHRSARVARRRRRHQQHRLGVRTPHRLRRSRRPHRPRGRCGTHRL